MNIWQDSNNSGIPNSTTVREDNYYSIIKENFINRNPTFYRIVVKEIQTEEEVNFTNIMFDNLDKEINESRSQVYLDGTWGNINKLGDE